MSPQNNQGNLRPSRMKVSSTELTLRVSLVKVPVPRLIQPMSVNIDHQPDNFCILYKSDRDSLEYYHYWNLTINQTLD